MLSKRLINSNDAGGGGDTVCSSIVDNYNPFTTGGVALYQLNGNANDVSGNYNGTASNVTYGTGKFGQAAVFNGSTSKVRHDLQWQTNASFSFSVWVKPTTTPTTGLKAILMNVNGNADQTGAIFYTEGNKIAFIATTSNGSWTDLGLYLFADSPQGNVWTHYVIVKDGSTLRAYVNNILVKTVACSAGAFTASSLQDIGGNAGNPNFSSNFWDGSIDQVRIFDRALNYTEVVDLYHEQVCVYACASDNPDIFQDGSGVALYQLNWDGSDSNGVYDGVATDVSFVNGKIDSAGSFNGSSSKIDFSSSILPSSGGFSISFWLKWNGDSDYAFVFDSSGGGAGNGFYAIAHDTIDTLYWNFKNGSYGTNISVNYPISERTEWTHFVISWDGTTNTNAAKIYKNTVATSGTQSVTQTTSQQNFKIGYVGAEYFNGDIDQVRIFNKALSAGEVTTLYNEVACEKTCTTDDNQLVSDCIAYYKLDGNADDALNTYDGTPTNVSWTQGRFGSAGGFNGSSSSIDLGSNLGLANNSFSFSIWINANNKGSDHYFVGDKSTWDASNLHIGVLYSAKKLRFSFGSTSVVDSLSNIEYGIWQNWVCTYNASSNISTIYLNGVLDNSASTSADYTKTGNIQLGNISTSGFNYDGSIDQVRIYDRAITATEVETLYNEVACPSGASFNTVLYEGNGYPNAGTQNVGGVGFQPDFVWIKERDAAGWNIFIDSIRGIDKYLFSNSTIAEFTQNGTGVLSLTNDGFALGADTNGDAVNRSYGGYVAWCWKAGGDAVTNTDGSITSEVSANVDAGFSIVSWTGLGANGQTVGHGLNTPPQLIITKCRNLNGENWYTYSEEIGNTKFLALNLTSEGRTAQEAGYSAGSNFWNDTSPTSSVFSLGNIAEIKSNNHIAYCFHSVAGFSKIGSYSGQSTNKTVSFDFEPAFVMIKNTTITEWWAMADNKRLSGVYSARLFANRSDAEYVGDSIQLSGNTMILKGNNSNVNLAGSTFIYMAFANQF